MAKSREELQKEYDENIVKLKQYRRKGQRLENRIRYYTEGDRKKRNHRLITRGAAVESIAPEVRSMTSISLSSPPLISAKSTNWPPCVFWKMGRMWFSSALPGVGKTHLASALGLVAAQHRFSTYCVNCHQFIEQLKKAHFENRLPDKFKVLAKYKMLIIDEIGCLPMDIQGANLFFQLIAGRYEKTSTVFTSNKTFSQLE